MRYSGNLHINCWVSHLLLSLLSGIGICCSSPAEREYIDPLLQTHTASRSYLSSLPSSDLERELGKYTLDQDFLRSCKNRHIRDHDLSRLCDFSREIANGVISLVRRDYRDDLEKTRLAWIFFNCHILQIHLEIPFSSQQWFALDNFIANFSKYIMQRKWDWLNSQDKNKRYNPENLATIASKIKIFYEPNALHQNKSPLPDNLMYIRLVQMDVFETTMHHLVGNRAHEYVTKSNYAKYFGRRIRILPKLEPVWAKALKRLKQSYHQGWKLNQTRKVSNPKSSHGGL